MRRFVSLFACLLLTLSVSAQKYQPLDCGITLSLLQEVNSTGKRSVFLKYQTNDVYECSNYDLGYEYFPEPGKIHIVVKGLAEPSACDDVLAPAVKQIDITNMGNGTHNFTTVINRQFFKGELVVTPSSISLNLHENTDRDLLKIHNPQMNLIPENTVWGKVEYPEAAMKEIAVQFFDDLKKEGATLTQLEPGNYGEFYLHQVGTTEEKEITPTRIEYPFVFHFEGDPERLALLVKMYSQRYGARFKIIMKFSNGKRYTSITGD